MQQKLSDQNNRKSVRKMTFDILTGNIRLSVVRHKQLFFFFFLKEPSLILFV